MGIVLYISLLMTKIEESQQNNSERGKKNWRRKLVLVLFIGRSYLAILSSRLYSNREQPGNQRYIVE